MADGGTSRAFAGDMTPDELKSRTKKFAVDVIRFAKAIPKDHINDEIASQLADAATSTAAHYRAVCRAKSRADFINKLSGAIEEVDESALWLEILDEAQICAGPRAKPLWKEADELTRIFVRSRETARARQKREREHQAREKRLGARRQSPFDKDSTTKDHQSAMSGAIPIQPERLHAFVEVRPFNAEYACRAGDVPLGLFERLANAIALGGVTHFMQP